MAFCSDSDMGCLLQRDMQVFTSSHDTTPCERIVVSRHVEMTLMVDVEKTTTTTGLVAVLNLRTQHYSIFGGIAFNLEDYWTVASSGRLVSIFRPLLKSQKNENLLGQPKWFFARGFNPFRVVITVDKGA